MFKRTDGIVDFDKSICIGCKACMAACPYDAIFINPEDHSAEKCNFCAHRIDVGLEPACVVVCPTQAILIGDMNDQSSYVAQIVNREAVNVRRPEKETLPKLFYKGAHQATLDPLAARRPEGNLFMWSEQSGRKNSQQVTSGHPSEWNNSAGGKILLALLAGCPLLVGMLGCVLGGTLSDRYIRKTGDRKWGRRLFGMIGQQKPWYRSSMLSDVLAGRRLELEWLNGVVVRLGLEHGVPTPANAAIYAALKPYADGAPELPSPP